MSPDAIKVNTRRKDMPSNNNAILFTKLVKSGNKVIKIRGCEYVYKSKNCLVPKFGIIANKVDYCEPNEKGIYRGNPKMNKHGTYRIALQILNDKSSDFIPVESKELKPKKEFKPMDSSKYDELLDKFDAMQKKLAKAEKKIKTLEESEDE